MNNEIFRNKIIELENSLYEVKGLDKGEYDSQAIQYDKLISNYFYNKIMWGNSPKDYSNFCKKGLKKHKSGIIADIGCGTLGFTNKVYAEYKDKDLYLCDLSLEMLKIGKNKLKRLSGSVDSINFLRSDALNMPFKNSSVQTVLSFGIFHIFENPSQLIKEMTRILNPDGQLFLTSLCTDRKFSGKYLNLLHKKGHVSQPLNSSEIIKIIEENEITITESKIKGGMIYISGKKNTYTQHPI